MSAATVSFRRELADRVTVTVEGTVSGVDPDVTVRCPGRVVVTMPDFVADELAHALGQAWQLVDMLGRDTPGMGEAGGRALTAALAEAAAAGGFRCPTAEPPAAGGAAAGDRHDGQLRSV